MTRFPLHRVAADALPTAQMDGVAWGQAVAGNTVFVGGDFAALAASRLRPAADWRLATDWADYAEQMREVLDAEPLMEGGPVPRWDERPVTKFERKGLAVGRTIIDLRYVRRS